MNKKFQTILEGGFYLHSVIDYQHGLLYIDQSFLQVIKLTHMHLKDIKKIICNVVTFISGHPQLQKNYLNIILTTSMATAQPVEGPLKPFEIAVCEGNAIGQDGELSFDSIIFANIDSIKNGVVDSVKQITKAMPLMSSAPLILAQCSAHIAHEFVHALALNRKQFPDTPSEDLEVLTDMITYLSIVDIVGGDVIMGLGYMSKMLKGAGKLYAFDGKFIGDDVKYVKSLCKDYIDHYLQHTSWPHLVPLD